MNYSICSMVSATLLVAVSGVVFAQVAVPVTSNFDSGTQGWTWTSGVTWQASGGNPGGFLRFVDSGPPAGGQISAPPSFLGNWTALSGTGALSFDFRIVQTGPPYFAQSVVIAGPGGTAHWSAPLLVGPTGFQHRSVPISSSSWVVTSGSFSALIASVTSLVIYMPVSSNSVETTDLDNVELTGLTYPGSQIDFRMTTGINAQGCTTASSIIVSVGGFLVVCLESTGGAFIGAPYVLAATIAPHGAPIAQSLPGLWLDLSNIIILVNGTLPGPFGYSQVLIPGGTTMGFQMPAAVSGSDIILQSAVFGVAAPNGVGFSEAHIIYVP